MAVERLSSKMTRVYGLALIILALACNEPPADQDPQSSDPPQVTLPPPEANNPEAVFLYWQQAMDLGQFDDAWRWSSPSTKEWIHLLRSLPSGQPTARKSPPTVIEGIRCVSKKDTAICHFAELQDDRLVLDSIRLLLVDGAWQVDLDRPEEQSSR